ncbi:hypothetical protein ABEB36_011529 [Hypothenemus hampei]|uniref:Uncharacterized protein n=1 Tax=Hypothenemus hampei TaxID=57062 RepID=A0ABD1E8B6_HYPHA
MRGTYIRSGPDPRYPSGRSTSVGIKESPFPSSPCFSTERHKASQLKELQHSTLERLASGREHHEPFPDTEDPQQASRRKKFQHSTPERPASGREHHEPLPALNSPTSGIRKRAPKASLR